MADRSRRIIYAALAGNLLVAVTKFAILLEATAALIGLLVALAGTFAAVHFRNPLFDGVASIAIGVLLGATASVLARESKDLLIGEGAHPALTASILRIAQKEPG